MRISDISGKILCGYTNSTSRIQILRISNIESYFFERAVMPQSSILFETFQGARLEIHTSEMMNAILSDTIPCSELTVSAEECRQQSKKMPQTAQR